MRAPGGQFLRLTGLKLLFGLCPPLTNPCIPFRNSPLSHVYLPGSVQPLLCSEKAGCIEHVSFGWYVHLFGPFIMISFVSPSDLSTDLCGIEGPLSESSRCSTPTVQRKGCTENTTSLLSDEVTALCVRWEWRGGICVWCVCRVRLWYVWVWVCGMCVCVYVGCEGVCMCACLWCVHVLYVDVWCPCVCGCVCACGHVLCVWRVICVEVHGVYVHICVLRVCGGA